MRLFNLLLLTSMVAPAPGHLQVRPQVCFAPCWVRVSVPATAGADTLTIEISDYRRTDLPMPTVRSQYDYKTVPEGEYEVIAAATSRGKVVWREIQGLEVHAAH